MKREEIFDVTIIGGGPAGLYSAFYSGLRGMKTKVIEYQPYLGGKLHVYPEKMIWDVGGHKPLPSAQLIEQLVEQGLTFSPTVIVGEKVETISQNEDLLFKLTTSSGEVHYSKTVIVAVGSGILNPQKLVIEGAERYEVSNLNYTIKSLRRFKDRVILISGGGNSAVDWANELQQVAKKVYVSYHKENLPAHESQVEQLLRSDATVFRNTSITNLIADNVNSTLINTVELTNKQTGESILVDVDEVIINHGFEQDSTLLNNSSVNVQLVNGFYIKGNAVGETSISGLFAAGDIISYDGKVNLITGAFQDAVNAVNKAKTYIQPDATAFGMVSSHNEVFKERNREIVKGMIN
ncbi:MAG TPA: NAD(P)/FAD-dependent oxidoreductase [Rummeliibacillus sp.]|nr:NAD(P)/FAD-dependent oxidoreductase [Rummeliibacillus sp.]